MSRSAAEKIADAILDGHAIDWAAAESSATLDRSLVPYFRTISSIAMLFREADGALIAASDGMAHAGSVRSRTSPPTAWGHLHVHERIGEGTFGEVYRAWDPTLDRDVALKLLKHDGVLPDAGAAVLEEGRLLARVHHRNVVTIHGADRFDGRLGLWMELIEGETLQQAIDRGRAFSPSDAVRIGIELASAVGAVHDSGLIHRDIKAHNIMLARDGRVVLMDFGTGHDARTSVRPALAGTPLYLAPELLEGRPPSASSDIYSVGVALFYLLTRTYPVHGESLSELSVAHQGPPALDVRHLRPDVPRALALVIARALHRDPAQRQPTVRDLANELMALYGGLLTLAMGIGLALGWSGISTDDAVDRNPGPAASPTTQNETRREGAPRRSTP